MQINYNEQIKLYAHDRLLLKTVIRLVPKFVRPNHLTVIRFLLTPFVVWLLVEENYVLGVPLFLAAAATDALDGTLARTRRQITVWGITYDPVADKLLVGSVILLIVFKHLSPFVAGVVISFEALFLFGGWLKKRNGLIIPANIWGKFKMLLQVFGILFLLLSLWLQIEWFENFAVGAFVMAIFFAGVAAWRHGLTL